MIAAKKKIRWSSTTCNTVLGAELGMYPLETNIYARKLKRPHKVRNVPTKRLPATTGGESGRG